MQTRHEPSRMIALFGGSFNPVHNGHLAIVNEVFKVVPSVDEVWLVPDNQHHWKDLSASFEDRMNMLRLIESDPSTNAGGKIKASDVGYIVSQERSGMTVTIDVIRYLQKQTKNTYIFIAGSDQLPRLHEWHNYEELMMRLPFLIIPRKGYQLSGELPHGAMWLTDKAFEPIDDSATRVREWLKKGESISDLVPKKVEEYIRERGLYK